MAQLAATRDAGPGSRVAELALGLLGEAPAEGETAASTNALLALLTEVGDQAREEAARTPLGRDPELLSVLGRLLGSDVCLVGQGETNFPHADVVLSLIHI